MAASMEPGDRSQRDLVVREWQIIFSYSSYYTQPLPSPVEIGERLVQYGVAECAVDSAGNSWWSNDDPERSLVHSERRHDKIGRGVLSVEMEPDARRARVRMPAGVSGYPVECLYQQAQLRYSELKLFGDGRLPPPYVRGFLGTCAFTKEGEQGYAFVLYPQIKIFETGVVIVELRMFSSDRPVVGREFLEHYVNASMEGFDRLFVPPGLAAWTPIARPMPGIFRWYARPRTAYWHWHHQRDIARHTRCAPAGDFTFAQVSFSLGHDLAVAEAVEQATMPIVLEAAQNATDAYLAELERAHTEAVNSETPSTTDEGAPRSLDANEFDEETVERELELRLRKVALPITARALRAAQDIPREPQTVSDLALTIMRVAGVTACSATAPRTGLTLIVAGPGQLNDIGNYWVARPHVHLIRYRDQSETVSEDCARFGDAFGSIIARVWFSQPGVGRRYLPSSLRTLEDHGAYISKGATLWTYSRAGLRQANDNETHPDLNRGKLVYENQVKTELLDYGYALHRRIAERVMETKIDMQDVLTAQQDLAAFEWAAENTGKFGEIRDLLEAGWEALEVPRVKASVSQGLVARQAEALHRRGTATARAAAFLTFVGGMVSVPPLATAVLRPLWEWRRWWLPHDPNAATLFLSAVSLVVVGSIVSLGYRIAQHSE